MKNKIHQLVLFISIFLISCGNENRKAETGWATIEYSERSVRFKFPTNDFKIKNDTLNVDWLGDVYLQSWQFDTKKDFLESSNYTFNHYKYPEHNFKEGEIDEFFEGVVENLMATFDSELIYNRKISYRDSPGIEIYYFMPSNKIYFKERLYLINNEQYALTVITSNDKMFNNATSKFLGSFEINE